MNAPALTRAQAWRIAWTRGGDTLRRAFLHSGQMENVRAFQASTSRRYMTLCTRRFGKSYMGVVDMFAECIATPMFVYKYAAPTQDEADSIVMPHVDNVLATCPPDLQPRFNAQKKAWTFKNRSYARLAGVDGKNANRLRGTALGRAFVDEGGFADRLEYLIEDVLVPQTITTGGRIWIASTPPESPAHALARRYLPQLSRTGDVFHRTIYQVPHIPREVADEYVADGGGPEAQSVRREYFAEVVVDETIAVVPEFVAAKPRVIRAMDPPPWRDWYVSADFGFSDLTFVVFAWFDFQTNTVVVEDEVVTHRVGADDVAAAVKAKEAHHGIKNPQRYADAPLQLLSDLATRNGIVFAPAVKDDKVASLNVLRSDLQAGRVAIHPRCEELIKHLEFAVWGNGARTEMARVVGFGHFDGVDAMRYLLRVVNRRRNPTPAIDPSLRPIDTFIPFPPRTSTGWTSGPTVKRGWT